MKSEREAGALLAREVLLAEVSRIRQQIDAAKKATEGSDLYVIHNGAEMLLSGLVVSFETSLLKRLMERES